MAGFDDAGVFFSDNFGSEDQNDDNQISRQQVKKRLKDFIRQFHEGNFTYTYRDQLKRNYNLGQYWLEVDIEDVSSFDESLADKLYAVPTENLPLFEDAAKEVADEITNPRPEGEEEIQDIQVMLNSTANPCNIRTLKSEQMSKLVRIPGIVIAASSIKAKATRLTIQCRSCRNTVNNISVNAGLEGYALPRKCNTEQAGRPKCPIDPFFIVPDKCKCVDFQVLKLQEAPEGVPNGEMPRHMQLYADRYSDQGISRVEEMSSHHISMKLEKSSSFVNPFDLAIDITEEGSDDSDDEDFEPSLNFTLRYLCDKVVPGNRVTVVGIYSIKRTSNPSKKNSREKVNVGIRAPYFRIVGIQVDTQGSGRSTGAPVRPEEEEAFRRLAAQPSIYETIAKSIAPSIYGSIDMKKAIACLLFGGSRKRLPDGLTRRGDVNLLMLGDPGTAKSQLLKFVERCSPVAVYTSGKGSSAAGLTASVTRDPATRNFVMEGGAMVLADGGVVCIDEFDKMREDDRVAMHEAMEQQTISIAKAGITTTLNSRCSVLAAANSVYGRWDDTKGEENIDFMPTILSRFDMIFIVKDTHNEARDMTLAKHVMNVHLNALQMTEEQTEGEINLDTLKKYIGFCRKKCGPRLSEDAAEKLKNRYILMRNGASEYERETGKRITIPITVRQLEAIIRISESLAKMRLSPFATNADVDEALRLFQVSTLDAAMSGNLSGVDGFTTEEDQELLSRIEKQIKRRFIIGSQVSEHAIIQDFARQKYPERSIQKVLQIMLRRGEVQHRLQRKMLYRLK